MDKSGNTKKYRHAKRLTSFVAPWIKTAVKHAAKRKKMTVSKYIEKCLEEKHAVGFESGYGD